MIFKWHPSWLRRASRSWDQGSLRLAFFQPDLQFRNVKTADLVDHCQLRFLRSSPHEINQNEMNGDALKAWKHRSIVSWWDETVLEIKIDQRGETVEINIQQPIKAFMKTEHDEEAFSRIFRVPFAASWRSQDFALINVRMIFHFEWG